MRDLLHSFIYALNFFTSIPTLETKEYNPKAQKYIVLFAPFVGAILGCVTLVFFTLLSLKLPLLLSGVIAAIFYLIFYGFLHIEALGDMVDGYYASLSGKDPLTIMKDPHSGALGIFWSVGVILLKVVAIAYLLGALEESYTFVAILILSRLSFFYVLALFQLHKQSTFAREMQKGVQKLLGGFFFILYTLIIFLLTDLALYLFFLSSLSLFFAKRIKEKIGFINGDVLGSILELTELSLLLFSIWFLS